MATMPVDKGFVVTSGFGARWGTTHYGTDFGVNGGSGGYPVYAVKDGTVTASGPASGFGQWVNVDHPASNGGGLSVYGHIIPEVRVGQQVSEGQRIAHINPNSATNGGVAPHLHLEFHRFVWSPPGPNRLDPMTSVLAGAKWKGDSAPSTPSSGPLFGVDVSEHQDGMSLAQAKREGMEYAIIRTTDGTYRDRTYHSHLDDAEGAGMLTAAYHYLRNPSEGTTVAQQVQASLAVMGDAKRPVWIDVETDAGLHVDHIRECKRLFEAAGVRVPGVYSYVPYWENRVAPSEPDSHEFGKFWVAAYNNNPYGAPSAIYPGNGNRQWDYPLGNQKPSIWQFGSNARVAGFNVDINAFRGSRAELEAIFTGKESTEGGLSVSEADRIIEFIKAWTGPHGSDIKDVREQLTGGRDAGDYRGWPALGQNAKGANLTLVDAIAALRADLARLEKKVDGK